MFLTSRNKHKSAELINCFGRILGREISLKFWRCEMGTIFWAASSVNRRAIWGLFLLKSWRIQFLTILWTPKTLFRFTKQRFASSRIPCIGTFFPESPDWLSRILGTDPLPRKVKTCSKNSDLEYPMYKAYLKSIKVSRKAGSSARMSPISAIFSFGYLIWESVKENIFIFPDWTKNKYSLKEIVDSWIYKVRTLK